MTGRQSVRRPRRYVARCVAWWTGWGLLVVALAPAQVRARPMGYAGVDGEGMTTTLPAALRAMAAQAGVIFVGTVTSVRRVEGDGFAAVGVVEVRFAVEQGIRGVTGASYTLREWGGLWPLGERRFVVGDRRLMLLHSPGVTGLSSPVGGFEGAIPVVGTGARVGAGSRATTAAEAMLDLRWIGAKLARSVAVGGVTGESSGAPSVGVPERVELRGGEPGRGAAAVDTAERGPTVVHGTLPRQGSGVSFAGSFSGNGVPVVAEPLSDSQASTLPVATAVALLRQWQGSEPVAR